MDIQVDGDNNRVAGRDYYENTSKPCPKCEVRFIERTRMKCNHCIRQENEEAAKGAMGLFALVVLIVWGFFLQRWESTGIEALTDTLMLSVMLVVVGYGILWFALPVAFEVIRACWRNRRQE